VIIYSTLTKNVIIIYVIAEK